MSQANPSFVAGEGRFGAYGSYGNEFLQPDYKIFVHQVIARVDESHYCLQLWIALDPWVKNLGCPILIELNFLLWRSHEPTEGVAIGLIVMKPGVCRQLGAERSSRACTIAALHVAGAVLHYLGVVQVLNHRTITSTWGYLRGNLAAMV
jgi:hypothetical protein